MKTLGTLLVASFAMTSLAFGQDCPAQGECPLGPPASAAPTHAINQEDPDEKSFQEVEKLLNEVLLVDEQGQFKLKKAFRDSLPIPAERVEGMLGAFVVLDDSGKIKISDREAVRPYLPMIKGFLGSGMERLQELEKLPPEERRKAMREMMGRAQRGEPEPEAKPEPKPETKPEPREDWSRRPQPREDWTRRESREETRPEPRRRAPSFRTPSRGDETVEERLDRIERSLARIERALGNRGGDLRRDGARRRGDFLRDLFNRNRDRRDRFQNRRRPSLGDLFRGRDRSNNGERGLRGMMRRGRAWTRGLRKLFEIMEPEDLQSLGEGLRALTEGGVDPREFSDPGKAMERLQRALPPEDAERFMEIFSEFIGSEEGRAFADQMDQSMKRLEGFINSEEGRRIAERVRELQEQFGGDRSELQDRIEELIQGRSRDRRERAERKPHSESEKRSSRKNHEDRQPERRTAPPSGKLY